MKRLSQIIKLILHKEYQNSVEHYSQPEIVKFYKELISVGLFPDEIEVLDLLLKSNITKVLIIGAGTGREAKIFAENGISVHGYDPASEMIKIAYQHEKIIYYDSFDQLNCTYEAVFFTRNLPSLLKADIRNKLISDCLLKIKSKSYLFIQPDILKLTWKNTFKLKLISKIGQVFKAIENFEEGDTFRINIDYNANNSKICYYHYFPDHKKFIHELLITNPNLKIQKLSRGYFQVQTL